LLFTYFFWKTRYAGWEQCEYVGTSLDLDATLQEHLEVHGSVRVAHIRALSFLIPSQGAMDEVADEWRNEIKAVGGRILSSFDKEAYVLQALEDAIPYDDEDDDEDEDDEEFMAMRAEALSMARGAQSGGGSGGGGGGETSKQPAAVVLSPFDSKQKPATTDGGGDDVALIFNKENVDKVLDEVRPYLISDGGNVSVDRVDVATKNVYLKLEGACGSCPSSTVTMQMGIERVLKEKFDGLGEVVRVEAEGEGKPTELTYAAVAAEVDRIKPAIIAMGGVVNIVSVDRSGVVELRYRGAKKVRQGVEMAIMDLEFVKEVMFMSEEED
jgi:Fe-S cluster biogenesis protein NfuA